MDHGFLLTLSIHLAEIPTSPQKHLGTEMNTLAETASYGDDARCGNGGDGHGG